MSKSHVHPVKYQICPCGQTLLIGPPESREILESMLRDLDSAGATGYSVIVLDKTAQPCPNCGQMYFLPSAETFDFERHGLDVSGLDKMIDDLENKPPSEKRPSSDDLPF